MSAGTGHLGRKHPLAEVASRTCAPHRGGSKVGGVACGACWEAAIRADERWLAEVGDGPALAEPTIDQIAVERAASMSGQAPALRPAEKVAAARLMRSRGLAYEEIGQRLSMSKDRARQIAGPRALVAVS